MSINITTKEDTHSEYPLFLVDCPNVIYYNNDEQYNKWKEAPLLEEYKEACRRSADLIDGWRDLSKNDLCRKYIENKDNPEIQSSYFAAILYKYWSLIPKYYYMSSNVATAEDCYEWLVDSVVGCLKAASWDREDSSIYKDPNGPDKVINRCMKCARLTYYQFINRKKRKDNFGMVSLEEMAELFGSNISEPEAPESIDDNITVWAIQSYIKNLFVTKKDYFVAVMLDCIVNQDVFDITVNKETGSMITFSIKKLTRFMSTLTDEYVKSFATRYEIPVEDVEKGLSYFRFQRSPTIKAKIQLNVEKLQHTPFFKLLHGDNT